jgi:1-acyl-sn-glycerol-3-phosphate acyltransferase
VGNLLLGIFSKGWAIRWKNLIIKNWALLTAHIIGLKINIKGTPPKPPFFLVSNHLSYIDVIPLWRYLDATFVAKSEVKSWPFFGFGTRALGVLFINRELKRDVRRMNNQISEVMGEEQGVILFPEGTSTKGEKVLSFNSSLLQYPAYIKMPVNYVTISYKSCDKDRPAHENICWWGEMPFFSHFWELLKIPGFVSNVRFGEHQITKSNRKELAYELHQAVSEQFIPVTSPEY